MGKKSMAWLLIGIGIVLLITGEKTPIGSGSGLGVGGEGRQGKPKTDEERRAEHLERHGSEELPVRGAGLTKG